MMLGGTTTVVKEYLDANLRTQVEAVIREQCKEQNILESEIAINIATKLSGWAKLLALIVGLPLGILVITLGAIGIKDYVDFMRFVSNAKKDTEQKVEVARKEGEAIASQYQSLKDQLAQTTALAKDVKVLSARVNQISEHIGFVPTAALTSDLKAQLESSLGEFQKHLQGIGYKGTEGGVKIDVSAKQNSFGPAYYQDGVIHVEAAFATDIDVLFREYSHHALLSSSKDRVSSFEVMGLESGLASYLSCSFNGDPAFGENSVTALVRREGKENSREFMEKGAIHNLQNNRKFSELKKDPNDIYYVPAEVWGGAFWNLRELFGEEYTDRLLFETWKSLREKEVSGNLPAYFYNRLVEIDESLQGNHLKEIREVFSRRGLSV